MAETNMNVNVNAEEEGMMHNHVNRREIGLGERFRNVWYSISTRFLPYMDDVADGIREWSERMAVRITRWVIIGLILNVIASTIMPELPSKCPVLFGFFDGAIQFAEYSFKMAFGLLGDIIKGHPIEGWNEAIEATKALLDQFMNWLATL